MVMGLPAKESHGKTCVGSTPTPTTKHLKTILLLGIDLEKMGFAQTRRDPDAPGKRRSNEVHRSSNR